MNKVNIMKAELASRWCAHQKNIEKLCKTECPIKCNFEINKFGIEGLTEKYFGNSNIILEVQSIKKYNYISVYQIDIWQYLNDLGGIFGLYLGITLIDLSIIFKISTFIWQNILYISIRIIYVLNLRIHRIVGKIIKITILISKLKWKNIATFISTPFLLIQMYKLLYSYFQYSTITTYDFLPYNMIDNKLSIDDFPSITICYENLFQQIISGNLYEHEIVPFFDKLDFLLSNESDKFENELFPDVTQLRTKYYSDKNYYLKDFYNYSSEILKQMKTKGNLRTYFVLKDNILFYRDLLMSKVTIGEIYDNETENELRTIELEFLIDFLVKYISFNSTQIFNNDKHEKLEEISDLFRFYDLHYSCELDLLNTSECSMVKNVRKFFSPHGNCVTYLSGTDTFNTRVNSIKLTNKLLFEGIVGNSFRHFPFYIKRTIFCA